MVKKEKVYIFKYSSEKKFKKIAGLTLIEILIAVVISSLMMAAMFTSYTIVNNTYRQVTDRAKLSRLRD